MKYLEKLLEISSKPIVDSAVFNDVFVNENSGIESELKEIINLKNGFYAFEGALHFFSNTEYQNYNIWKKNYKGLADNICCFAEDAFGNKFSIKDNSIFFFDAETAETEFLAANLEEWAKLILDDYNFHTGFSLMHEWQTKNGALPVNNRLVPKKPFVMGGEYDIDNLHAMDSIKEKGVRLLPSTINTENLMVDGIRRCQVETLIH